MIPDKCPDCGTKLGRDTFACPNCPMTFSDEEPAASAHPLKETALYRFLPAIVLLAAVAAAIWGVATSLLRFGEESARVETPSVRFGGPIPTGAASAGSQAKAASEGGSVPATPSEDESSTDESMTAISIGAGKESRPKAVKEWKLRGAVYDLTTLTPLAGCRIVFTTPAPSRHIETRTDSAGRYKLVVPALRGGGYSVTLSTDGYAPTYLNPGTEGVRQMAEDVRLEMARDLAATLTASPAQVQAYDERPLITDFYLAPRK